MGRSRLNTLVVWAACVLGMSCVRSQSEVCGNFICPDTLACLNGTCVDREVITSCEGQADGATCNVQDQGSGTCSDGACNVGYCGDGKIEGNKACDGSNLNGETCLDFGGSTPGGLTCTSTCSFDTSGCTDACGDGKIEGTEQCDGSDFGGKSCTDYGYYGGTLACTSTCTVNLGGCSGRCGDGIINGFEQCDGSALGGVTCTALGYPGSGTAPLTCDMACTYSSDSCTCGGALCAKGTSCDLEGDIPTCE
jgi:hypothetical protein